MPCTRTGIPLRSIPAGDGHVGINKMKNKIIFTAILIIFSVFQLLWANGVPWTKEDEEFAVNFLEKLRYEKPDLFRTGDLLSRKFICVQYADEFGGPNWGSRVQYNFEYHFSSGWCIAKVILSVRKQEHRLLEYKIYRTSKSVNNYDFKFSGDEKITQGAPGYPGKYFVKTYEDGEVRRAGISNELNTSIGTLRVIAKEFNDKGAFSMHDTLVLNHKKIFRGGGNIRLYGVFNINHKPHILIGENCGGSGCRFDDLSLLALNDNREVKIIRTDDFYSEDNSIKANLKGKEIIIDLGLYKGKNKTAIYSNNELKILYKKLPYKPLTTEQCADLYEIAKGCIRLLEIKEFSCNQHAVNFSGMSNANTWALRYISNEPGFNQELFDRECFNACETGNLSEYNKFSKRMCGLK